MAATKAKAATKKRPAPVKAAKAAAGKAKKIVPATPAGGTPKITPKIQLHNAQIAKSAMEIKYRRSRADNNLLKKEIVRLNAEVVSLTKRLASALKKAVR